MYSTLNSNKPGFKATVLSRFYQVYSYLYYSIHVALPTVISLSCVTGPGIATQLRH